VLSVSVLCPPLPIFSLCCCTFPNLCTNPDHACRPAAPMGQNTPCTSLYKGAVSPPDLNRHRSKNLCGVTKGATPPSLWFLDPTSAVEVLRGSDHHRRPSILRLCIELVQASQGTQSPPLSLSTSLDYSLLLLFGLCIMSQWTPMCMWFARQFFSIAVSHFFYLARGRFSATPPPVPLVCVRTDCTVYRQALLLLSRYVMGPIFPRPCKLWPPASLPGVFQRQIGVCES